MTGAVPTAVSAAREQFADALAVSAHARVRMQARGLSPAAVEAALRFGRRAYVRGACIHAIGRKEVGRMRERGVDLAEHEGVHVVCSCDGAVITTYRNRDLRGLRPRPRRRRAGRLN